MHRKPDLKDFADRLDLLERDLKGVLDVHAAVTVRDGIKALIDESVTLAPDDEAHKQFRKQARVLRQESETIVGEFLLWMAATQQRRVNGGYLGMPRMTDLRMRRGMPHRWMRKAKQRDEPSEQLQRAIERYGGGDGE